MLIMWFWTWAKGLEDEFDGANRRNLSHFIMLDTVGHEKEISSPVIPFRSSHTVSASQEITFVDDQVATEEDLENEKLGLYLLSDTKEKRLLPRVETAAVFHKLSAGKGVPHAFYGQSYSVQGVTQSTHQTGDFSLLASVASASSSCCKHAILQKWISTHVRSL
jgi:KUP system potassium uptake protein